MAEVVPNDPQDRDPWGIPRPLPPLGAVKGSEWSYIRRDADAHEELFDLRRDPGERDNRAGDTRRGGPSIGCGGAGRAHGGAAVTGPISPVSRPTSGLHLPGRGLGRRRRRSWLAVGGLLGRGGFAGIDGVPLSQPANASAKAARVRVEARCLAIRLVIRVLPLRGASMVRRGRAGPAPPSCFGTADQ